MSSPILAKQLNEIRRQLADKRASLALLEADIAKLEHAEADLKPLVETSDRDLFPVAPVASEEFINNLGNVANELNAQVKPDGIGEL
jgi:prefoldin subunit 5